MGGIARATLVITTRNRHEVLLRALASAVAQTVPLEIIVLDDASTDGTAEAVASKFPQARCVRSHHRQGYIRLRNRGAELATTPYIVSLDDDAVFTTPHILQETLARFSHPRIAVVTIPLINVGFSPQVLQQAPEETGVYVAANFVGTAHILNRDVFRRVGGYREILEHQAEELDFTMRLLDAGYFVRLGHSDPIHHFPSPKRDYFRMHFYSARNGLLVRWLNWPWPAVCWGMLRSSAGQVWSGVWRGGLGAHCRGVAAGWRDALRYRGLREPVDAGVYALFTKLVKAPQPFAVAETLLVPPVGQMVVAASPPPAGLARQIPAWGRARVAWLIGGDEAFGTRQAVRGLATAVRPVGVEAVFLSLADGPFARGLRAAGFSVFSLGLAQPPHLRPSVFQRPLDYLRLRRYQRQAADVILKAAGQFGPQALHVLWPDQMPLAGAVAQRLGIPCLWEMPNAINNHSPAGAFGRWFYQRQAARYGITVLANSRYTASTFGRRPVKPHVVYLGADAARFDPARVAAIPRGELGIPEDAIVLGIFARLEANKGQDRVLAAMLPLARQYRLWLMLVGAVATDGPFANALRSRAAAAGLADRLCAVEVTASPERYYGAVDIAVNATVGPESFGFSVVEAMMMGKPVLAHALGGPAETILDGVTGWHVANPSVEAFREGLERALAEQARWREMGAAGRARALEEFSLDRQAGQYVELLLSVLGTPPAGSP